MKILLLTTLILLTSCICAPNRYEGQKDVCFQADRCLYMNKDNKDKSVCFKIVQTCARILTMDYCRTMPDPDNCWKTIE